MKNTVSAKNAIQVGAQVTYSRLGTSFTSQVVGVEGSTLLLSHPVIAGATLRLHTAMVKAVVVSSTLQTTQA